MKNPFHTDGKIDWIKIHMAALALAWAAYLIARILI